MGRADLQQRPRPREGDVQSCRNDHDWVRGFGGGIVELLNRLFVEWENGIRYSVVFGIIRWHYWIKDYA